MNDVKNQFRQAGGNVTIRDLETGGLLNLTFKPGETRKKLAVSMGGVALFADLVLEEIPDAALGAHNLAVVVDFPKIRAPMTGEAKAVEVTEQLTVAAKPAEEPVAETESPVDVLAEEQNQEMAAAAVANPLPVEEPVTTTTPAPHQGKRRNRR